MAEIERVERWSGEEIWGERDGTKAGEIDIDRRMEGGGARKSE
jgi:hypothetical protein